MIVFIYNNTKIVCRWCSKRHISGPKIAQIPYFTDNSLEAPQRICKPYINVFKHTIRTFVLLFSYSDINIVCIECPNTSILGQEKCPKMQFFINNRSQTAHAFKKQSIQSGIWSVNTFFYPITSLNGNLCCIIQISLMGLVKYTCLNWVK